MAMGVERFTQFVLVLFTITFGLLPSPAPALALASSPSSLANCPRWRPFRRLRAKLLGCGSSGAYAS
jgi:hypothetical protein